MCVAMPGKVLSVEDNLAEVDFNGNIVKARAGLVEIEPGDHVLVHAGLILQKLTPSDYTALDDLFQELEEL